MAPNAKERYRTLSRVDSGSDYTDHRINEFQDGSVYRFNDVRAFYIAAYDIKQIFGNDRINNDPHFLCTSDVFSTCS
jgi:hypothetical protein